MRKILALTLFSCLMAMASFADSIWQETFNYTNGAISITSTNGAVAPALTNWITHSGALDAFVNNRRLEVNSSSANGGLAVTRTGDINRQFSTTNNSVYTNTHQLIYASFIVNFTNLPTANGAHFAHFKAGTPTSSTFQGRLWALIGNPAQTTNNFTTQANTFRLGVSQAGNSPNKTLGVDLALNTDYQVVMGWDPVTLTASTLWVNPIAASDASVTTSDTFTPSAANIANSFAFRQASGFGAFLTVSNVTIATTFLEALTNTLSTNAVAPKIINNLVVGLTNFVGSSFALSAIASGQGQTMLTYQWYRSNSVSGFLPYTNPNGNSNVVDFINAQTTDSGYYRLAVTTLYGLSVTSSPAKVLVSATPVPPTFLIQASSRTIYRGQNTTLMTTVSSPGNCTYTWFSNNVAVATTGPDATGTSSFDILNVVTNNSATYKVAVTNDVVPTGVVSSNAVVTVLNPPGVTIAFLRSLVDPVTFATTASPTQPYQVTGIVTTYTNITTGNTASYYLQDATAGINIFATFGSTFRPAQGDVITFVGVLSSFSSGLELFADTVNRSYTSYSVVSNNFPLLTPLSVPFTITNAGYANMNTNIAGRYVQLTNVFFGVNAGSAVAGGFVAVTNGLGQQFNLWFSAVDPDTQGQILPDYAKTVTGVMFGSQNSGAPNFAVAVTKWSDIVTNPTVVLPIPLNTAIAGTNITFTWTDPTFTLQTSTNLLSTWTDVTGATSPFVTNTTIDPTVFYRLFHP